MAGLFCGIDIGSTNVKIVLADEEGRALHTSTVPTPRVSDGFGPTTDATALVSLIETMIVAGWREVGQGVPLTAIAAAGVGEDGLGVDDAFRPTGLVLPWFDTRAGHEATDLRRHPDATPRAGIAVAADRTAAKWLWLRRHRPGELTAARQWIALTDYPAVWWSGVPFMSHTLAPRTACYDVYARRWIKPLLAAAGAPPLPGLREAGISVGTMRPGPLTESGAASPATLLVAGGHDHPVAAAAIRGAAPGARVDSMGTANLVYGETPGSTVPAFDPYMAYSVPPSGELGLACLGVIDLDATLAPARNDAALFRRVLSMPRLPGAPMSETGEPEDAVRCVLEHASFQARRMFAAMDDAGAAPGPIFSTGGRARSRAFLELRASVFGQPIQVVDEPELSALGAAFLACQAAKGAPPHLAATRQVGTVYPVPAWADAYAAVYPVIRQRLDAVAAQPAKPFVSDAPEREGP